MFLRCRVALEKVKLSEVADDSDNSGLVYSLIEARSRFCLLNQQRLQPSIQRGCKKRSFLCIFNQHFSMVRFGLLIVVRGTRQFAGRKILVTNPSNFLSLLKVIDEAQGSLEFSPGLGLPNWADFNLRTLYAGNCTIPPGEGGKNSRLRKQCSFYCCP
jgi:hypothetical protein